MDTSKNAVNKRFIEVIYFLLKNLKDATKGEFAENLKLGKSKFSEILNERMNVGVDTIADVCKLYDVNPAWLLTGEGKMLLQETIIDTNMVREPDNNYGLPKQSIPLYELEASAGIVSLFNDHNASKPIDYIQVPNLPKCDGALYIVGDSMYPLLKSHDIVIYKMVKELCNHIFVWGEMYLVSWDNDGDDHVVVKWMHKSELGPTHVKLVSENRHHDALDIPVERIRALALVKASIRMNTMS